MRKPMKRKVSVRKSSATATKRTKARTTNGVKKSSNSKKSASATGFKRGADGFNTARKKREKQEEDYERMKDTPYDFRIKPGEEAEVVIVDNEEPFFVSLHKVKNAKGYYEDAVCIADTGQACPLCESTGKEGSYTMVLTVLDRRPYKTREGKVIKASKKLFKVKSRNLPKFQRQYEKYDGKLRGLKVLCHRDGDKEAAIGEDLTFEGRVKESVLKKFRDLATPADYEKIFELPSPAELRKRHNVTKSSVAGSEEFDNEDDEDYDMDDVGWGDDD